MRGARARGVKKREKRKLISDPTEKSRWESNIRRLSDSVYKGINE
eukprot:SAG11_NODE_2207_length_3686_cov_7.684137_5_plen_45_part_00